MDGKRPERPAGTIDLGLSDGVWELIEMCWRQEQETRPIAHFVLSSLSHASSTHNGCFVAEPEEMEPNVTPAETPSEPVCYNRFNL